MDALKTSLAALLLVGACGSTDLGGDGGSSTGGDALGSSTTGLGTTGEPGTSSAPPSTSTDSEEPGSTSAATSPGDETSSGGEPDEDEPTNHLEQPGTLDLKVLFAVLQWDGVGSPSITQQQAEQKASAYENLVATFSYGLASADVDITPPLQMPMNYDEYLAFGQDLYLVRIRADMVKAAADAGYDVDDYIGVQVWGTGLPALGNANTRTAWLSGQAGGGGVIHELGHGFMWQHANYWDVDGADPFDPGGSSVEYGDGFDIMGSGGGHPNPMYKLHAGWLPPANVLEVEVSGSYTLTAYEEALSDDLPTALRIRRNAQADLWVFYRTATGAEGIDGANVTWNPRHTILGAAKLIDATPDSQAADWLDAPIDVGQSVSDPTNGISIAVTDRAASTLTVDVTVPEVRPDDPPIIGFVEPELGRVQSGMVTYRVTAVDPDDGTENGDGITNLNLTLARANDPLGFTFAPAAVNEDFAAPPYEITVDTTALPDGHYALKIEADEQRTWLEHIIDNTGPSSEVGVGEVMLGRGQRAQAIVADQRSAVAPRADLGALHP